MRIVSRDIAVNKHGRQAVDPACGQVAALDLAQDVRLRAGVNSRLSSSRPSLSRLRELARLVGESLRARGLHVTTAESCTGGWIAKAITDIPGSSEWFDEGYVTYSNEAKQRTLGVKADMLRRHGAVSEAVVREMAVGALRASGADFSIAVSGIAGPDGGLPGKPVGTVWFCCAERRGRSIRAHSLRKRFRGGRNAVRLASAITALRELQRRA